MVAWMTCSASMWLSRSLFSFIYEVIFILRDKECPQHVCIAPHIIHSSIRPMKQTSHYLIIRLSGQSGCAGHKGSCKEICFFSSPVFCLSHIFDQAIKCCDSLNPSPPLSFPSPKLEQKQSSCWWDRRLWAAPLPLKTSQLTTPNIWRVAPKDLESIIYL